MNRTRTGLLAFLVLAGTALGALSSGWLNLGDDIEGNIEGIGQEDVFEFTAIAGTEASFRVRASGDHKTLRPRIRVIDLTTLELLVDATDGKTVRVNKLALENTGSYELIVSGADDSTGHYRGKTDQHFDKHLLKQSDTVTLAAGETLELEFVANKGWELEAKIKPKGILSQVFMTNAELTAPSGAPVSLTGFLEKNGPKVEIDDLPLPELGTYLLRAENTGLSGLVKWKIELDPDVDGDDDDDD